MSILLGIILGIKCSRFVSLDHEGWTVIRINLPVWMPSSRAVAVQPSRAISAVLWPGIFRFHPSDDAALFSLRVGQILSWEEIKPLAKHVEYDVACLLGK
jgi:hypothetical protein